MPERNLKQATIIPSARILDNPVGTAPGWLVSTQTSGGLHYIVSMPGVPFEMKRMWEQEVEPWLRPMSPFTMVSRTLKTTGLGESAVDQLASDLTDGANPTVAPYAKADGVHLRITAKAGTAEEALALIAPVEQELRARLGDAIYGADDDTPAGVVSRLLEEAGLSLALIEIGVGAAGAVSAALARSEGLALAVSSASLQEASRVLTLETGDRTLTELSTSLCERAGVDLVLAIRVEQQPATTSSVQAEAELVLATAARLGERQAPSAKTKWTTSASEVPRLVGLAGLNMLRKWLLKNRQSREPLPNAL
jgi:nicotinamide-nucleotide amidase